MPNLFWNNLNENLVRKMRSITVLIYKSVKIIQNESHVKQFEDGSTIKGTVATFRVSSLSWEKLWLLASFFLWVWPLLSTNNKGPNVLWNLNQQNRLTLVFCKTWMFKFRPWSSRIQRYITDLNMTSCKIKATSKWTQYLTSSWPQHEV